MTNLLSKIDALIWGVPLLILIVGLGMYLSIKTGFSQIRMFPQAFRLFFAGLLGKERCGHRALCTALAATVGTGNLAGVAGAIAIGGPGAVFWMWICGLLGMMIKMCEVLIAMKYRKEDTQGGYLGGPMYVMEAVFPQLWHFLPMAYALFGILAALGIGNAIQVNTILDSVLIDSESRMNRCALGLLIGSAVCIILSKGSNKIGAIAETIVPFAALIYILFSLIVIIINAHRIPVAFAAIIRGAFSPASVTGGAVYGVFQAMRVGAARGIFSNEAGMGTASIAHAGSDVREPIYQGLLALVEVFLDTLVICTLTAMVILCSGYPIAYGSDPGITLTLSAFSSVMGEWVCVFLAGIVCILAFATILGWSLYGGKCAVYLWGEIGWKRFIFLQSAVIVTASVIKTQELWLLSQIANGLMALPNLITLVYISPQCIHMINHANRKKPADKNVCRHNLKQAESFGFLCHRSRKH